MTKFIIEGMFKNSFDGTVKFSSIGGIDFCDKFLYICDCDFQRIQVFDLNLNYIKDFGSGKIKYPIDVSIHSDRIYILSQSMYYIYCYNKDCTFQKEIELTGEDKQAYDQLTIAFFMVIDLKCNFLISNDLKVYGCIIT